MDSDIKKAISPKNILEHIINFFTFGGVTRENKKKHQVCWNVAVHSCTEDPDEFLREEDQKQDEEDGKLALQRFPHQISYDYHCKYIRKTVSCLLPGWCTPSCAAH